MEQPLFNSLINQILTKTKISSVISRCIKVVSKGNSLIGICPFHNDHNPSLNISDQKKIFKCFSCGIGGNVITFVQKFYKFSFITAIIWINDNFKLDLANIELLQKKNYQHKLTPLQNQIAKINKLINNYFNCQLISEFNKPGKVKKYCQKRNLTMKIIKQFTLGYASDNRKIINFCKKNEIDLDDCVTAGILTISNNEYQPFFQNRLIFPIIGLNKEIVGFSGRVITNNSQKQKYINVKTNALFIKNELLFNLNKVENDIGHKNIIVTEGFFDVIALWKSGFSNAVASLGTNINGYQILKLHKYQQKIILAFNNDNAGLVATINAIALCIEFDFQPKVVNFSRVIKDYVNDIDELLFKHSKEKVCNLIDKSISFFDFFVELYNNHFQNTSRKLAFVKKIIRILNSFPSKNSMAREIYLKEWSRQTGISLTAISAYLDNNFTRKHNLKIVKKVNKKQKKNYSDILTKTEQNVLVDFVRRWNVEEVYHWFNLNNDKYNHMLNHVFNFLRTYLKSRKNFDDSFQWKDAEYIQLLENNVHNSKNKIDPEIIDLFKNLICRNNKKQTDLTTKFWQRKNNFLIEKRKSWIESFDNEFAYLVDTVDENDYEKKKTLQEMIGNKNAITAFSVKKNLKQSRK